MPRALRCLAVALLSILVLGTPSTVAAQKKDPYLITRAEILDHQTIQNAYDAVEQLRPRFLRASRFIGGTSPGSSSGSPTWTTTDDRSGGSSRSDGILVVVNGVRLGGVTELRRISVNVILSIHYLSGTEASEPYGNNQSGVIEVTVAPNPIKPPNPGDSLAWRNLTVPTIG